MIIDLINYIYLYVILDNFTPFKDVNMNLYSKNLYILVYKLICRCID